MNDNLEKIESIVLGGGCFWCIEAVFKRIKGVTNIESGYAGGTTINPSYYDVCSGTTGHAEVTRIEFDQTIISLEAILKIFFLAHDPTTLNRQGNDVGTQYRSIILYDSKIPHQREVIEKFIKDFEEDNKGKIITTEVKPLEIFYKAEEDHQDYYTRNPNQSYCRFVIQPKLDKVLKEI